jgi:hypothetical protein
MISSLSEDCGTYAMQSGGGAPIQMLCISEFGSENVQIRTGRLAQYEISASQNHN